MVNMKILDTLFYIVSIALVLYGFWMFKDFAIETFETTNAMIWKYKFDFITGTILIVFGLAAFHLVENDDVKKFFNKKKNGE